MKPKPDPGDLRERALRLLARREHSRAELMRKLETAGFAREDITPLLDDFEKQNWLSDRRFAESYIADHCARAGSVKLAYELRQRGVASSIIDELLRGAQDSELERAREVWLKKYGTLPADTTEKAKQMRFMLGRGFSVETTLKLLTSIRDSLRP